MARILNVDGKELPNGDLPVWARILFKYGAITAIALYLIYQNTQGFGATLTSIRDEQRTHITQTNFYLRAICVNGAKDETQARLCILPGEK